MVPTIKNNVKEELSITENNACLEMTSDSASDRTLIARVCGDPEYCDRNACIRKCCPENEFYIAGCNKFVVPIETTASFHDVFVNQTTTSTFDMTKGFFNKIQTLFLRNKFN